MAEANSKVTVVSVGPARVGGAALALIAGPCVIESERLCLRVGEQLAALTQRLRMPFIFKASYDKANRSSARTFRGPGLKEGLKVLAKVKRDVGVPVLTDVHSVGEVAAAAEVCDGLQVPAFLCRQTDLVLAVARSGRAVNVKKGQFLAPRDMKNVVEKVESVGCRRLLLTERGVSFGYNNLVVDMRALPMMRALGYPVIFDATHSVQQPGGAGDRSGGDAAFVPALARAAVAAGCDGVFIETHPTPATALSDGPNMIPLRDMRGLLETLCAIREALR
ncbi:MAG: 3-deoxy-8-phosphooctulonate synthase [Verrucomicrobia bacterium]|nr:3-deoxy-8-phosphooctulonate synthase [Verrucomicrobiota bacterium]